MTDAPTPQQLIASLELAILVVLEEIEALAVSPLKPGVQGVNDAGRLARSASDLAALASACEVLARCADQFSDI